MTFSNPPPVPPEARPIGLGVQSNGRIAITGQLSPPNPNGKINLQDMNVLHGGYGGP